MLRVASPLTFFFAGVMFLGTGCGEAAAGDDGEGGFGGSEGAATVGTSRASTSGTSGDSGATSTGQGGADACVGPDGRGLAVTACEMTNVGSLGTCPETNTEPLALQVCQLQYGYLTQGSWENLLSCLGKLPATYAEACDETSASDAVASCLSDVTREACPNPRADAMCESIAASCESSAQEFPLVSCKEAMAPLSDASIASYQACTGDALAQGSFVCAELHGDCLGSIGVGP
jgi:hypothetical protein